MGVEFPLYSVVNMCIFKEVLILPLSHLLCPWPYSLGLLCFLTVCPCGFEGSRAKDISAFFHVLYSILTSFESSVLGKFWQELCVLRGKAQFRAEGSVWEAEPGVWEQQVENTLRAHQTHLRNTQRPQLNSLIYMSHTCEYVHFS